MALTSVLAAQDVGFEGPSFSGAGVSTTPTESKPQNKVWFNDGQWWGVLWSNAGSQFRIHRLNIATHAFVDTGVNIENRTNAHSDALWDGTKLYIATHIFTTGASASGNPMRLYRYSYNTATDAYSLDTGFPVVIGDFSTESLTIDKDSTGIVWAAWTQANRVRIAHSTTSDTTWSSSVVLPTNTTNLNADDLCAMTAYGGNRIGIAWSDQVANAYRFSFHIDGQADTTWSAIEGISSGETDDHINLATHSDGRVFLAGKNAGNNLLLFARSTAGAWTRFVITTPTPILTRPCVVVNETASTLQVFMTGQDTGEVFEKTSPLSSINFGTGTGTIRLRDSSTLFRISNPSSTKQSVTAATGLVVLAHHDTTGQYWHHEVAPIPPPVANFSATPTTGTAPLNVSFTDASTGTISSRLWSFGDGGTSSSTSPSRNYTTPGSYTVSLTLTGPSGTDTETKTAFIVVTAPPPVANFSATPTTGTAPLNVSFTDASTGSINSRTWNFGDGGTSTSTNPSHSYAAGTYTVTLTVNGPGGSDSETKTNLIVVSPPASAPVANFTATPTSGTAPLNVSFTNTSTGDITSRSWNFGDGGTSTATNPSHSYAAGTYTVTLTVNGPGGSDSETKTNFIVVSPPTGAPVANFSATPTTGTAPLNVAFTDASTGSISTRSWNFGDGGTSSATNPSHSYAAGTYTVTLTVNGPGGSDSETKTSFIVVSPPTGAPVANFSGTPTSGTAPLSVAFTDASTGSISSRTWNFGDGGTSTALNPSHVYAAGGSYTVTLTVNGPGGSDSEIKTAYVVVSPPSGSGPVLSNPTPGTPGSNSIQVTGATPNSVVGFYMGQVQGTSLIVRPSCPSGVPIQIAKPWVLLGTARANSAGVATLNFSVPTSAAGKTYYLQMVDQVACKASNRVTEVF